MQKEPWPDELVTALNEYQQGGYMHPYTCGNAECRSDLVATPKGFACPNCDYKQEWCFGMPPPKPDWIIG